MAFHTGSAGQPRAEINVTPMIDLILVLLVIFMIVSPIRSRGLPALIPQPPVEARRAEPRPRDVIAQVASDGSVRLNRERVGWEELPGRLALIYRHRADAVIFVSGDKSLEFRQVARLIDVAHGAGVTRVGLMTQPPQEE